MSLQNSKADNSIWPISNYVSNSLGDVLYAIPRTWEGRKSRLKCSEVDENMSENGTYST